MLLCYKLIRAIRQSLRPYRFNEFIERKELKMANYIIKYFGNLKNRNIDFKNKLSWFDLNKEFDYRLNTKYGYIYTSSAYNELISNVSDCFVMAMIGLNEMHKEAVKKRWSKNNKEIKKEVKEETKKETNRRVIKSVVDMKQERESDL